MPQISPILRELAEQVDTHQLENWEAGETIARPLGLLYRCLNAVEGESEETRNLYLRICRLDPIQAIDFTGNTGGDPTNPNGGEAATADGKAGG